MNIREAKIYFDQQCASLFDKSEAEEIFIRIAEELTSMSTVDIKLNTHLEVDDAKLNEMIAQLSTQKPLQYILGYEWFYNLKLVVNEHVLIPRPETEELVRWILDTIKTTHSSTPTILDIGTGSGCIPIVLKKEIPKAEVAAMDISQTALDVAMHNALTYALTIDFIQGDIIDPSFITGKKYDIIVSNPPYITIPEKAEMNERVVVFEPEQALFVTNNDPLQFYNAILLFSEKHLADNGTIFLELNRDYSIHTKQRYDEAGYETVLRKDMYGNNRMLMAKKRPTDVYQ